MLDRERTMADFTILITLCPDSMGASVNSAATSGCNWTGNDRALNSEMESKHGDA